jgi:hypothetical protein
MKKIVKLEFLIERHCLLDNKNLKINTNQNFQYKQFDMFLNVRLFKY